ncbi:MAG TPA: DNA topoisomerase IV subunit B, partial [Alcanivorax sp.]|nr:DNA topoisomerase IV subunit B [Alcanivorax sp.]
LSKKLEVFVKRDGEVHRIEFAGGEKTADLEVVDTVGKRNTGTMMRFWPDEKYFDSPNISVPRLRHLLRAKAVLCPGLLVTLENKQTDETETWQFADGLVEYLVDSTRGWERVPAEPFEGAMNGDTEAVDWAVLWLPEGGELVTESYVNLIPTTQGGTHVNGLRSGLLEAMREFCEFRNLLPRGVKLTP